MRRRRKTKYTWLPIAGNTNSFNGSIVSAQQIIVDVTTAGETVGVLPITFDRAQDIDQSINVAGAQTPLVDIVGNEYFLKRIVGKCFVNAEGFLTDLTNIGVLPAMHVAVGWLVADEDTQFLGTPRDFTSQPNIYNPLRAETMRQPWIWRRSWILSPFGDNAQAQVYNSAGNLGPTVTSIPSSYPSSNIHYGSVLDGPHIDAKTARRVRQQERLFWVLSAQTYPWGRALPSTLFGFNCRATMDVRLLGGLRKARNRSSF